MKFTDIWNICPEPAEGAVIAGMGVRGTRRITRSRMVIWAYCTCDGGSPAPNRIGVANIVKAAGMRFEVGRAMFAGTKHSA